MVRSMTAFSLQEQTNNAGSFLWEIRTVNHRFLDVSLRLPEEFRTHENTFRNFIRTRLKRGKVEASLRYTPSDQSQSETQENVPLAKALLIACQQIESFTDNTEPLKAVDILQWPGVASDPLPDTASSVESITDLLEITLKELISTREREGEKLSQMIEERCDQVAELVMSIRKRRPTVLASIRENILNKIDDLKISPDQSRLEQELVFLAQKLDVDEELDRIMAHLDEITNVLEYDEPIGRRLDFLMQELNREANTLSAKSNDTESTQISIDLKVFIEQMREQIQNIE